MNSPSSLIFFLTFPNYGGILPFSTYPPVSLWPSQKVALPALYVPLFNSEFPPFDPVCFVLPVLSFLSHLQPPFKPPTLPFLASQDKGLFLQIICFFFFLSFVLICVVSVIVNLPMNVFCRLIDGPQLVPPSLPPPLEI